MNSRLVCKPHLTDKRKNIISKIVEIIDKWINILVQGNQKKIKTSIKFLEKVLNNGRKNKKDNCERMKSIE